MSDSVQPHRWQSTRLPCPWDSPGKNTGVGCHFLHQCMKVKGKSEVSQSCPTLSQPHGLQPTRLLHPWDFPAKSAGMGCHCLLQSLWALNWQMLNHYSQRKCSISLLSAFGYIIMGFPGGSVGKESACNAGDTGDMGSIPESGRSPGRWHSNPLQYSCLENPMYKRSLVGYSPQSQRIRRNWAHFHDQCIILFYVCSCF